MCRIRWEWLVLLGMKNRLLLTCEGHGWDCFLLGTPFALPHPGQCIPGCPLESSGDLKNADAQAHFRTIKAGCLEHGPSTGYWKILPR